MAIKRTADQIATDWANGLSQSTGKIQSGIEAVTVAPGQAAAANKNGYVQGVAQSADKWARNVAAVDLASWKSDAINKGIPRIASGAQAAQPKMQAAMSRLIPYINSGLGNLPKRGTLDQNIARMDSWVRYMAGYKR